MKKPSSEVCDQVILKPACSVSESSQGLGLMCLYSNFSNYTIKAAKDKGTDQTAGWSARLLFT